VSASLLEIVDLGDGEIVLQRADDDSEPLVVIRFSEESRVYMMDNSLEVAKAMIQAGIQAAAEMAEMAEQGEVEIEPTVEAPRVLH
jgi:dTDP-D-glucose 4,6-dehydratase